MQTLVRLTVPLLLVLAAGCHHDALASRSTSAQVRILHDAGGNLTITTPDPSSALIFNSLDLIGKISELERRLEESLATISNLTATLQEFREEAKCSLVPTHTVSVPATGSAQISNLSMISIPGLKYTYTAHESCSAHALVMFQGHMNAPLNGCAFVMRVNGAGLIGNYKYNSQGFDAFSLSATFTINAKETVTIDPGLQSLTTGETTTVNGASLFMQFTYS